ncbi:MAG: prepilin-type N-terminal cleavage/methylation domain-containing protein [Deltaproteobacteria bacterium]|jgi:Tfp pilus assembly protein PilV|nr:prepilin-type N-terminal cleavage/methylation domain-containing protein [Deltaproteobacteria bacterium]
MTETYETMQPVSQAKSQAEGFTLVETLIALTVILFGFMAALVLHTTAIKSGTIAELQTMAVFLAESKMEEFRFLPPTNFPDNSPVYDYLDRNGQSTTVDTAFYTRGITLKRRCPTQFTNELTVEIKWPRAEPLKYTSVIPGDK